MRRTALLLLAAAALAAPSSAQAAKAPSPGPTSAAFYGVNVDGVAFERPGLLPAQLRRIARTGAGTVRWAIYWPHVQPYAGWEQVPEAERPRFVDVDGIPTDWSGPDAFVLAAARARLAVLPVLMRSAPWAATEPYRIFSPPRDPATYGRFAGQVAARYGSRGTFWAEHPEVRRSRVIGYQIWNEPAGFDGFDPALRSNFWDPPASSAGPYVALLRAAHGPLHAADPRANVIAGGLFGRSWIALRQMLRAGAGRWLDTVALHPYTRYPVNVLRLVRYARRELLLKGLRSKDLIVTELTWTRGRGRVDDPKPWDVTPKEQPRFLRLGLQTLRAEARRLRLRGIQWFTWMTTDRSRDNGFEHSGLVRLAGDRVVATPALRAWERTVRRMKAARR